jgi:hypothetical protein
LIANTAKRQSSRRRRFVTDDKILKSVGRLHSGSLQTASLLFGLRICIDGSWL